MQLDVIVPLNEEQLEEIKNIKKYKNSKYIIISLDNKELFTIFSELRAKQLLEYLENIREGQVLELWRV
ncbi:hypothetical protein FJQ98_12150 [Lysinibacillus agricola]|uniref:Uncharacterized protein n=1 Tax=Lysinibacillus agricola TaxID=2590012 RepID=A0ABX7AY17_9BACI|nr:MULTISPECIES: hypothetical protein [Lysinibacillus]QQP14684.1 hypothetical protein FJQ98_12150 [Lysinibacillus agricola]